jgi:hypothetical protein
METLRGSIISYAFEYLGIEEVKGNMGFKDPEFEAKMREIGFRDTYAWCALFCELCWTEAYEEFAPEMVSILEKEFSAGTVRTFRHFKAIKWTSKTPEAGDIVIWRSYRRGKAMATGHAAIVIKVVGDVIHTIEGNTNNRGGREGYTVAAKQRSINFTNTNGLRMLGFIKPKVLN